jgi:hypothetical protein
MKRIRMVLMVMILIFALIGVFGCNTNPPNNPPPDVGRKIKFALTGGGPVAASSVKVYQKDIEITAGQTIYLFPMQTPGLKATLYIDGVAQPDQIDISEDLTNPGDTHCFVLANYGVAYDGLGTGFDTKWDAVGRSRVKATLGDDSVYVTVFTFGYVPNCGYNNGFRLEGLNSQHLSNVRADCFLWNDWDTMNYVLTGKSYIAANTSVNTWRQDLYNIAEVDLEALAAGVINRKLFSYQDKIIVAENPYVPGSYIKIVRPGNNFGSTVWDYTETTEFRR